MICPALLHTLLIVGVGDLSERPGYDFDQIKSIAKVQVRQPSFHVAYAQRSARSLRRFCTPLDSTFRKTTSKYVCPVHLATPPGAYADMSQDTLDDNCFDDQGRCRFYGSIHIRVYEPAVSMPMMIDNTLAPQFYSNVRFTFSQVYKTRHFQPQA